MKGKTFIGFVAPSVGVMLALIAVPLAGVLYLAVHSSKILTENIEVETVAPSFGGVQQEKQTEVIAQPVLDDDGNPIVVTEYVGLDNIRAVSKPAQLGAAVGALVSGEGTFGKRMTRLYRDVTDVDFWGALEFTLLYTLVTTPLVLLLGFGLALAVNRAAKWLRGGLIYASLLPFIITPVVGSLSVYWLFLDNAVIASVLEQLGLGKVYFLKDAFTIRTLIIVYGVWHVSPFAFVVLYAGLQTVPRDSLEAARVDGAGTWLKLRYVVIPHLAPLFVFITTIHVMDAYRIFEPVLVFGSNLFANSMQYLTYLIISQEGNFNKAAAAALLTVLGVVLLLIPVLRRTWREMR